jgi:hypothetical protein
MKERCEINKHIWKIRKMDAFYPQAGTVKMENCNIENPEEMMKILSNPTIVVTYYCILCDSEKVEKL